jgi:3-dehydroquinate synthase
MDTLINATVGTDSFPVVISPTGLDALKAFLSDYQKGTVQIVADAIFKDPRYHPDTYLKELLGSQHCYYLQGGVESKSLNALSSICDELFKNSIPRDGVLIAIGGGVIGDIAGMAASIFQRGMRLVHVPTTATSMIDSCIGGKTGVNHANQVNLLGTYYNPKGVFIDIRFLSTLERRDLAAGVAEAIKMAITSDKGMVEYLKSFSEDIIGCKETCLLSLISWSVRTKLFHVSSDFKESSIRLLLNYGHTFGQSLESFYGLYQDFLRHGEAVSLGMCCAAAVVDELNEDGRLPQSSESRVKQHREVLEAYGLPTVLSDLKLPSLPAASTLYENVFNDKKRTSKGSRFILSYRDGTAEIVNKLSKETVIRSFGAILSETI